VATPPPSAEAQLAFLTKLQRLFAEGDFTATYKFALLIALADLAVERGADTGDALQLTTRQIAERFIQLYWRQAVPYGTGRLDAEPGVLVQNLGAQAAVITAIETFRSKVSASSPQVASLHAEFPKLLSAVAQTVTAQPLNYLQNFGGVTDEFLYDRAPGMVFLKPGVAFCFRRFQPLVHRLARSHWVDHIKGNRRNLSVLGIADDLEQFLFETPRQSLELLGAALRKLDGPKCFYCGDGITSAEVDHFIPFSQYPRDLAHNFVLAHPSCNRSKSDMLAAKLHLQRWMRRILERTDELAEIGRDVGMVADAEVSRRVASWGYASALAAGGRAWVGPNLFEHVDDSYVGLIGGGGLAPEKDMLHP
jgi:5-methylcytosine-specific restriction endonuclease McrA